MIDVSISFPCSFILAGAFLRPVVVCGQHRTPAPRVTASRAGTARRLLRAPRVTYPPTTSSRGYMSPLVSLPEAARDRRAGGPKSIYFDFQGTPVLGGVPSSVPSRVPRPRKPPIPGGSRARPVCALLLSCAVCVPVPDGHYVDYPSGHPVGSCESVCVDWCRLHPPATLRRPPRMGPHFILRRAPLTPDSLSVHS